ncbi:MAG TPA: hypothetical protein VLB82_10495 [Thermodesulfobacteriota bacterium]|nr:hypothetical protein [Thermodesulfobacteriota bacterium]
MMNISSHIRSSDLDPGVAYDYKTQQVIDQIFSSFADYLIGIKEIANLMIYIVDEENNELRLVVHRNMHQDFPRNFSRIEKTKYLARNIIKSNSVLESQDTNFRMISNKFGMNIQKGFIGFPIKDNVDSLSKPKGAILVWTSYINKFDQNKYNFIVSAAKYLSKSIKWNNLFAEEHN